VAALARQVLVRQVLVRRVQAVDPVIRDTMAITGMATGSPEQVSGCPPFDIGEAVGLRLSFLALLIA